MRRLLASPFVFALLLLTAACSTPDPAPRYAEITFVGKPQLRLDVGAIEVVNEYQEPLSRPHVEHLSPANPGRTAERWARDRVSVGGSQFQRAVLRIREASIVEDRLRTSTGLGGFVKNEQSERYTAVMDVALQILDNRGQRIGEAVARVERSRTVPEDITLNERERAWYELTESILRDMDTVLTNNVQQYLRRFLL
ncbi:hypothetical protein [Oceanibaculum pacificum]|uniref:Uncharacterized protein n=1 Tax=Oceanibaculum pacificum TaxID=580166 RepID=A0A154WGJ2_9PROT|nr:hypothetical protein [Oceanibaculum pacificum]KZD12575.1 hypothetical protein AUP43_04260 [Oceanibaculum pacificum]